MVTRFLRILGPGGLDLSYTGGVYRDSHQSWSKLYVGKIMCKYQTCSRYDVMDRTLPPKKYLNLNETPKFMRYSSMFLFWILLTYQITS